MVINDILKHWAYFIPRFLKYGGLLGGAFGALTYPLMGAFVGAPWGLVAGLVLGILAGIGVPIYNRFAAPNDDQAYQQQLTFGMGALTVVIFAVPLLFIYALPAGLTAAYVAHEYATRSQQAGEKRKNSDRSQSQEGVLKKTMRALGSKFRYVIALGAVFGTLFVMLDQPSMMTASERILTGAFAALAFAVYGSMISSIVTTVASYFILFSNRVFFTPETPKQTYKIRMVAAVSVLVLFLSMIVTLGVGAPFMAIAAGLGTAKYADWYYEGLGTNKAKRDNTSWDRQQRLTKAFTDDYDKPFAAFETDDQRMIERY